MYGSFSWRPLSLSDEVSWFVAYTAANSISHIRIQVDTALLCPSDVETVRFVYNTWLSYIFAVDSGFGHLTFIYALGGEHYSQGTVCGGLPLTCVVCKQGCFQYWLSDICSYDY